MLNQAQPNELFIINHLPIEDIENICFFYEQAEKELDLQNFHYYVDEQSIEYIVRFEGEPQILWAKDFIQVVSETNIQYIHYCEKKAGEFYTRCTLDLACQQKEERSVALYDFMTKLKSTIRY